MCRVCNHIYVYTTWSRTCILCGIESYFIALDTYSVFSAPLEHGYSRVHRFRMKIDKLLALHSGPNCVDPIWKYLDSRKIFLNTPFDIRQCIRRSKLTLKHYDCVRIFSDAFTNFSVGISCPIVLKNTLVTKFDKLHYNWMQVDQRSFFSYDWVLRYFLEEIRSPLVVYLKPKTCRRRDEKYKKLLNDFYKRVEFGIVGPQKPID